MASLIVHMAVAKEVNKQILKDEKKYLLGALAPDLAKEFGVSRKKGHFVTDKFAPNIDLFLEKYGKNLDDDFVFGYYVHLLTDYYWEKKFIPKIFNGKMARFRNGKKMYCTYKRFMKYMYEDYNNLDLLIIKKYDLDFKKLKGLKIKPIINEIPTNDICNLDFNRFKYSEYDKEKCFFVTSEMIDTFIDDVYHYILEILKS